MKKIYVLDTSVLVFNPNCLYTFPNSDKVIHISSLNELDNLKAGNNEAAKNARVFIRKLDELYENSSNGKISLEDGSSVIVDVQSDSVSKFGKASYADNQIIGCAQKLNSSKKRQKVILVSKDINMRARAYAYGIDVEAYGEEKPNIDEIYSGVVSVRNPELGAKLYEDKLLVCDEYEELKNIAPNECVYFRNGSESTIIALGRRKGDTINLVHDKEVWGIRPKNKEQAFAIDLLTDPDVPLVSLIGFAGTGKTLLCLAAGLQQLIETQTRRYNKIIVYRPLQPVGNELGYLPGDLQEKLDPWMAAVKDNMEFLLCNQKTKRRKGQQNSSGCDAWKDGIGQYADKIFLEATTYIRGRSIPNAYILLDESQNTSTSDIKTMLTRVGYGTKIVLTGDIMQTDGPHLDPVNNGLTHVANAFKGSELAGHVTLIKGERSALATEAAKLL